VEEKLKFFRAQEKESIGVREKGKAFESIIEFESEGAS
jgi:hypothetical protein